MAWNKSAHHAQKHPLETAKVKRKNYSTHRPGGIRSNNIETLPYGKAYVRKSQPFAWRPQDRPTDYFMTWKMRDTVVWQHIHAYGFPLGHLRLCEHEDVEKERQKRKETDELVTNPKDY